MDLPPELLEHIEGEEHGDQTKNTFGVFPEVNV